jgi:tRNA(Ile)-lysidine synthase
LSAGRSTAPDIPRPRRADPARMFPDDEVDALFAPLGGANAVLVAVSGGPDSTALLLMVAAWAKRRGTVTIASATVDHGLRPGSAAEAEAVAALCRRIGVPHVTLLWEGEKPTTGLQEKAREARYRLLIRHARALGAEAILTAHHADDQAETVLFRLLRGSGVAGLSGMEALTLRDGITLARPLLGVRKADLVADLRARGEAFVDDPSNVDPRFARTRLRALLRELGGEGLDALNLARLARRMAEADAALDGAADALESRLATEGPLDAAALFAAPIALVQRVLARRIAACGGRGEDRIGLEKIEALAGALAGARSEGRAFAGNVGGALVRMTSKGQLTVAPEPPRRATAGE